MDRFIDYFPVRCTSIISHLKSNMDRFIVMLSLIRLNILTNLKSNMDRFIEVSECVNNSE